MLLLSLICGLVFAQAEENDSNKVYKINFERVGVNGTAQAPDGELTSAPPRPKWSPLTKPRVDFLPEMFSSCEDFE